MRHETYSVGAYWGARREELGECVRRAELFFQLLARCDASFGQWYRAGRVPRGVPGHPVKTDDPNALERLLVNGRNRATSDKSVIEELGYGFEVWNQRPDARAAVLDIRCGAYTERVSNVCLLTVPSQGEASERMLRTPVLAQLVECMAKAWDPDWGVVTSQYAMNLIPTIREPEARVGWVTYFARRRGTVPPLPAPVSITPVGTLGMLVTLTPERFTASNPEHIALGLRVRDLLDRAGLLMPSTA